MNLNENCPGNDDLCMPDCAALHRAFPGGHAGAAGSRTAAAPDAQRPPGVSGGRHNFAEFGVVTVWG